MRPEVHLAKRLSKIICLRLVSWEQRIMRLMMIVLSLNFLHGLLPERKAIPKFGDLEERASDQLWTLVIGPRSFTANHSSFHQVCGIFAPVPVFWHFR